MFDLSELDRWDEALASLTSDSPVQTPGRLRQSSRHAAPTIGEMPNARQTGVCPYRDGRSIHDG